MSANPVVSQPEPPPARSRILDAARRLFADRSLDDVTMAEIGEAAGVSRATVFNHFATKRALVDAITADVLDYYGAILARARSHRDASTASLVRALFVHMGEGIAAVHGFYRGIFREIVRTQLALDEGGVVSASRDRALVQLVALLVRGQARGEIDPRHAPEDLAAAFDGLSHGTIVHWLYDEAVSSLPERMRAAAEIFLAGATGPPPDDEPLPDVGVPEATPTPFAQATQPARPEDTP